MWCLYFVQGIAKQTAPRSSLIDFKVNIPYKYLLYLSATVAALLSFRIRGLNSAKENSNLKHLLFHILHSICYVVESTMHKYSKYFRIDLYMR